MPRRIILLVLSLLVLGALLLAADWWIGVPEGKVAEYVGRQECARCHEQEMKLWAGSDHDRAMDLATPDTVLGDFPDTMLGDFGERKFIHVVFSDVTKLTDREVRTLLKQVENSQWALALRDAEENVKEKILGNVPQEAAALLREEMESLGTVRPADVTSARNAVAHTIRRLEEAGEIEIDFAVTSKFFRRGEKFFVQTDGPTGEMTEYEIKYTFGVRPLQQYLIEFPDGRVQCLPIAWDTEQKKWYHLYPGERIPAGDELHWTRPSQNWNHMCAECHSTNLQKKYDLKSNTFDTSFSEINVSCETCHGPGSLHVELADSFGVFKWDRRIGFGLPKLKDEDPRVEIETCAPCHARRRVVYPNHRGGKKLPHGAAQKFLDYYVPELLDRNYYYPDGQILEEDYVYGSFIQSKMYRKGVRCTDCHDPHSMRVKFTDPDAPWATMPDNRLCTDCHMGTHPAGKYDTPAHHHHRDSSKPGTLCVECHMPEKPDMVVDPRRDHSMRNPRPDLTISLNVPNACNGCHHDRSKGETPNWAEETLREWYGQRKGPKHFAYAIAAGRQGKPEGVKLLEAVTRRKDTSAMVRASALVLLGNYGTEKAGRTPALQGLKDPDGLVRAAAVRSFLGLHQEDLQYIDATVDRKREIQQIEQLDDPQRAVALASLGLSSEQLDRIKRTNNPLELADVFAELTDAFGSSCRKAVPRIRESYQQLVPMLTDPVRAVRTEAAWVLSHFPRQAFSQEDRKALNDALDEYLAGQESVADRAESHMNMAVIYTNLEQLDKAEREYLTAIRLNPQFPQARIAMATFYRTQGKKTQAEQQFRAAIKSIRSTLKLVTDPGQESRHLIELNFLLARTHYSFGTFLAEDKQRFEDVPEQRGQAERQFRAAVNSARKLLANTARESHHLSELKSLFAQVHYSFGLFLAEDEQRLEEVAEQLAEAVRLAPHQAQMHYNYGLTLQKLGQVEEAEKELIAANRLEPDLPDYLQALRILYSQQERWDQATRCAEHLARLEPDVSDYLLTLTSLYARQRRWDLAIGCAEQLVRQRPADPQMRALLQHLKREAEKKDQ